MLRAIGRSLVNRPFADRPDSLFIKTSTTEWMNGWMDFQKSRGLDPSSALRLLEMLTCRPTWTLPSQMRFWFIEGLERHSVTRMWIEFVVISQLGIPLDKLHNRLWSWLSAISHFMYPRNSTPFCAFVSQKTIIETRLSVSRNFSSEKL